MTVEYVVKLPEDELLARLGALTLARSALPGESEQPEYLYSEEFERLLDEEQREDPGFLQSLGKKALKHISIGLHKVLCLDADEGVKADLKAAREAGKTALATYLLVQLTSVGLDPATSLLVAALIAGVLIAAAESALCGVWDEYNDGL